MSRNLNNIQFSFKPYVLRFKFEAGTSRGVLTEKKSFLLDAFEAGEPMVVGRGEAGPLPKLSPDDLPEFPELLGDLSNRLSGSSVPRTEGAILDWCAAQIPDRFPSARFAFETALLDLANGGRRMIFDTGFYSGNIAIPINGLIWMGKKELMLEQIERKLAEGYTCIKMKIGAIQFEEEISVLSYIRSKFDSSRIVLRVDANGAFTFDEAGEKLLRLAKLDIHSIEQPIRQGQIQRMAILCQQGTLPIALDEELIGITEPRAKAELLEAIRPQYIILKPTLHGGIRSCREWIHIAESMGIGWWMTSALESNIGLNAIAQFTSTFDVRVPQGLGTGQLYHNNIGSPLSIRSGLLRYETGSSNW